jgi:hypothetical protein
MKAYLVTTCILFGLVTLAHVMRVIDEGTHLAAHPWFLVLTAVAALLCVWAGWLLRNISRQAHNG